jgi:acyl-coenzyme A thioesterase PaaI-like protein
VAPSLIRRFINLWPPLLFSGIRVKSIDQNWRHIEVELRLRWWNRNAVGTMFGGSLYAMTDAFYPLMLQHNLGPEYIVLTKAARIEFIAPGRDRARATFELSDQKLDEIRNATAAGESFVPDFAVTVVDRAGKAISHVDKLVYVRRRRASM